MTADNLKLALSVLVLAGGIYGFYYLETQSDLVRVLTVLAGVAVAGGVALLSAPGQAAWEFAKGTRIELRKVVWPSSKETLQVTMMVFVIVVLIALFLWIVDWSLLKIVTALTGPRS